MKKTFTFLGVLSALLMCAFPVVATGNTPDPYAVSAEQSTITVKGKVVDKQAVRLQEPLLSKQEQQMEHLQMEKVPSPLL